ncbi:hypothetical protein HAX54_051088 [Datura stramonium]|uniref:Uncharacterized protein n=1 Tax=Datura stramonium TaxID=4076 RepID=A0ABS8WLZ6_DATST|nr:hypothetical protein [Datura stramonium]
MMEKVMEHHFDDGPSHSQSIVGSNGVTMTPTFRPTRGGARKRIERTETAHHLRDENIFDEGDDSSTDGSSSNGNYSNSDEGSGSEATSSPEGDSEPMRGDILKGKKPSFRDSLRWQEVRIIDSELPEYPEIEGKYKFYGH